MLENTNPDLSATHNRSDLSVEYNRPASWLIPNNTNAADIIGVATSSNFALWASLQLVPQDPDEGATLIFDETVYDDVEYSRGLTPVLYRGSLTMYNIVLRSHVVVPVEARIGCAPG